MYKGGFGIKYPKIVIKLNHIHMQRKGMMRERERERERKTDRESVREREK